MTAADGSNRAENAINVSCTSGLCVHCYGLGFGFLKCFAIIVIFQIYNKATIMKVFPESSTLPSLLYIVHIENLKWFKVFIQGQYLLPVLI